MSRIADGDDIEEDDDDDNALISAVAQTETLDTQETELVSTPNSLNASINYDDIKDEKLREATMRAEEQRRIDLAAAADAGLHSTAPSTPLASPFPSSSSASSLSTSTSASMMMIGSSGSSSGSSGSGSSGVDAALRVFDRLNDSLTTAEHHVGILSTYGGIVSPLFVETMKDLKRQLDQARADIENAKEEARVNAELERNDVDFLLGWNKLPWKFKNVPAVDYYRACSRQTDHESLKFTNWYIPEYFSEQPLLHTCTKATCVVGGLAVLVPNAAMHQAKIEVTIDETANQALAKALAKLPKAMFPPETLRISDFVFKVLGNKEFIFGDKPFFSYAHVRKCLRDGLEHIDLTLMRRPEPVLDPDQQEKDEAAVRAYKAKIPPHLPVITKTAYRDVPRRPVPGIHQSHFLMSSLNIPLRIKVIGLDNVNADSFPCLTPDIAYIGIRTCLFHGTKYLDFNLETPVLDVSDSVAFASMLQGSASVLLSTLPREVRVGFLIFGKSRPDDKEKVMLGWVIQQLVDETAHLATGRCDLKIWSFPGKDAGGKKHGKKRDFDPNFWFRAQNLDNRSTNGAPPAVLRIAYDSFVLPVVAPLVEEYTPPNVRVVGAELKKTLDLGKSTQLMAIIKSDPLFALTPEMKDLLWSARHYLTDMPHALPKVLGCVNWGSADYRNEAHRLLKMWAIPASPVSALELLDAQYADYTVREYAVGILSHLSDDQLQLFLLQLVQCIKCEPYHDSPLSRFLLERAIQSPYQVGHTFFWHLKAEVHDPAVTERFALLMEEFLAHSGQMAHELRKQASAVVKLQRVAEMVVHLKRKLLYTDQAATREYASELEKLNKTFFEHIGKVQIPLNPKWEGTTLIVEKCRYMSSKMVPLWLTFRNADEAAPPIIVIFKSGDDLRQDLLTLQLLRVMDKLWLTEHLDMRLKPYSCIATGVNDEGEGVGMIEVVLNSETTSGIQIKHGGGAGGALKLEPIDLFIREHNRDGKLHIRAVENFVRSCAGYCVATFVLGIGDRHNGNIMVTKSGHLFHIDFGHFLGNFKSKFGIKRERAAFVFTPEMAYVMGGKNYNRAPLFGEFKKLCSKAFRVLRANASLIENLFILMVGAGMPELMLEEDIHYLRDKLYLNLNTKQASNELQSEISKSLESSMRRIDNYIHNLVHGRK